MKYLITILILTTLTAQSLFAQPSGNDSPVRLRGYVKAMPGLQLDKDFSNPAFNGLIHNRLNFMWGISDAADLTIEGRNRLIYNEMYESFPGVEGFFAQDDGLLDMSWVWLSDDRWIGHTELDRIYMSWRTENWRVRAGRQRINWGINLVSNPNDLFNTYSFFDFDYEERPGADALRIQHYISHLSNIELAVNPAREAKDMVAAAKYVFNTRGFDIQSIAGYFKNRLAVGGGWAGHIRGAGFKGEATWFYDLEQQEITAQQENVERANLVIAAGLDYMFSNGTFGVVEFLYNGGHERKPVEVTQITQPLRPDNIMFSKYAITISADHSFSPIFSGGLSAMVLPDTNAAFLMPQVNYSVAANLDFQFVGQLFFGGGDTIFAETGAGLFTSLNYSF
ncbi:MAG: hypothetical protein ACLFN2_07925 [Bacteroidales bacterium]